MTPCCPNIQSTVAIRAPPWDRLASGIRTDDQNTEQGQGLLREHRQSGGGEDEGVVALTDTRGGRCRTEGAAGPEPPGLGQVIINSCPFSVNWRLSCPVSELDSGTSSCLSQPDGNIRAGPVSRLPRAPEPSQPCCAFRSEGREKKKEKMADGQRD